MGPTWSIYFKDSLNSFSARRNPLCTGQFFNGALTQFLKYHVTIYQEMAVTDKCITISALLLQTLTNGSHVLTVWSCYKKRHTVDYRALQKIGSYVNSV